MPAGFQFSGLVGLLPGGQCRVDANIEVSSFISNVALSLDRASVRVPLEVDGPRSKWLKMARFSTVDANIRASFKSLGWGLRGGFDDVAVYVRVD